MSESVSNVNQGAHEPSARRGIIYLAPLIPSTSGSGGRRAVYNHLQAIATHADVVELICIDFDAAGISRSADLLDFSHSIYPRAKPKISRTILGKLRDAVGFLLSTRPRAIAVTASPAACSKVQELIASDRYETIVVDHFTACGMLCSLKTGLKLVYIAHNDERKIVIDNIRTERSLVKRALLRIELSRVTRLERKLLDSANLSICISSADAETATQKSHGNVAVWPELGMPKKMTWSYSGSRKVLFVGSSFYPNVEAVKWLLRELGPKLRQLDRHVKIVITGLSSHDMGLVESPAGFEFTGFVPYERLEQLHLEADLFISPVIRGSGVKIKVLEAAAYGMPLLLSAESWKGLGFSGNGMPRLTREPISDAAAIVNLLDSPDRLAAMSEAARERLAAARLDRRGLYELIRSAA